MHIKQILKASAIWHRAFIWLGPCTRVLATCNKKLNGAAYGAICNYNLESSILVYVLLDRHAIYQIKLRHREHLCPNSLGVQYTTIRHDDLQDLGRVKTTAIASMLVPDFSHDVSYDLLLRFRWTLSAIIALLQSNGSVVAMNTVRFTKNNVFLIITT